MKWKTPSSVEEGGKGQFVRIFGLCLIYIVSLVGFAYAKPNARKAPLKVKQVRTTKQSLALLAQNQTPIKTSTQTTSAALPKPAEIKSEKIFGFTFTVGRTASLYDKQDGSLEETLDFTNTTSTKLNKDYTLTTLIEYSHDQRYPEKSDWGRGIVGLGRKATQLGSAINLSPKLNIGLPISKESAQRQSLIGNLGLSGKFSNQENTLAKGLGIYLSLGVIRNFHRFETKTDGNVNTQYAALQTLGVDYDLTEAFSLSATLTHYTSWSYQNAVREYFNHSQELGYKFYKVFVFTLGHQFGGPYASVWKADGSTSNYALTDENNSYYYTNLTYSY